MTRNLFVVSFILGGVLIAYFSPWIHPIAFYLIAISYGWLTEILRLRYMGLNWRQILLTLLLGPFTFLLGRDSDYWWRMWQKDPVKISN